MNGEGEEEEEKRVFLRELLERVLERVEYGGEWEWNAPNVVGEGGEDEEDVDWGEMRKVSSFFFWRSGEKDGYEHEKDG